jgi:hypothetical protein
MSCHLCSALHTVFEVRLNNTTLARISGDSLLSVGVFREIEMKKLITYFLTPWSRVLLEKLTGLQLVKKFPHVMEPEGSLTH